MNNTSYALSGVRILDLTQVAIGPYMTMLLAGLGAEVIKVESNRRADTSRGAVKPVTKAQMDQYPGREPGERPWNRTAYYNQRNRGKLGITLDFARPEGRDLLLRLAAVCDAVTENFRASVLERQGITWEALHAVNPRLVYLKLSSQGNSGPERDYGSLGSTLEQTAGLASITGYADSRLPMATNLVYPDPVGALLGVGVLIAGLRDARRSGEGQFIDFSQRELTVGLMGEAMLDYTFNGRVQAPMGNRHPSVAPHGVYPCRPLIVEDTASADPAAYVPPSPPPELQPSDQWLALAVETDAQWQALCKAMGNPPWSHDARFATALSRWQHQEELDRHLADWTRDQDALTLTAYLQERGVPAGAVQNGRQMLHDRALVERGWWEFLTPVDIGYPIPFTTSPWRLSSSPHHPGIPAPQLGEHNDRIYRGLLGLSDEEMTSLMAADVIGVEPKW